MHQNKTKVGLIQPSNDFQVSVHKHALSLTFPYLINELKLNEKYEISLYVEDKNNISFKEFIEKESPNFVLITTNTATFPNAIEFANTAKQYDCLVVLGGLFATMNSEVISLNYDCFDIIIKGVPPHNLLELQLKNYKIIEGKRTLDIDFEVAEILSLPIFDFYKNDPVCYEITFGCAYNCNFCSLRSMWGKGVCSRRKPKTIINDFSNLNDWTSLKIIDDDILQSIDTLSQINNGNKFKKIVAETRIDRVNTESIGVLKEFGITHLILGVESFDENNLHTSAKTKSKKWKYQTETAIDLCVKNDIIPRPVMQLLYPNMSKSYLKDITPNISSWTPQNGIEIFFVFYAPHPGLKNIKINKTNLITNDLAKFDHLSPVYKPNNFTNSDVSNFLNEFNKIVDITNSVKYNPYITSVGKFHEKYNIFFDE